MSHSLPMAACRLPGCQEGAASPFFCSRYLHTATELEKRLSRRPLCVLTDQNSPTAVWKEQSRGSEILIDTYAERVCVINPMKQGHALWQRPLMGETIYYSGFVCKFLSMCSHCGRDSLFFYWHDAVHYTYQAHSRSPFISLAGI